MLVSKGPRGRPSTWTPHAFAVWKMSHLSLIYALDLSVTWWSNVIMCVLNCGISFYYRDFVITCYWILLSNFNLTFHHVHRHVPWKLCNFSWRTSCQTIMIIGVHLITIDFSASQTKL